MNENELRVLKERSRATDAELTRAVSKAKKLVEGFKPLRIVIIGNEAVLFDLGLSNCKRIDSELDINVVIEKAATATPDVAIIDGDSPNALEILKKLPADKLVKIYLTSGLNGSFNTVKEYAKVVVFKPATVRDLPWLAGCVIRG